MTNGDYHICKTCRMCRHADGGWVCISDGHDTEPRSSCDRYRPGCCENCNFYSDGVCSISNEEKYELDVCSDYDPAGSRR